MQTYDLLKFAIAGSALDMYVTYLTALISLITQHINKSEATKKVERPKGKRQIVPRTVGVVLACQPHFTPFTNSYWAVELYSISNSSFAFNSSSLLGLQRAAERARFLLLVRSLYQTVYRVIWIKTHLWRRRGKHFVFLAKIGTL